MDRSVERLPRRRTIGLRKGRGFARMRCRSQANHFASRNAELRTAATMRGGMVERRGLLTPVLLVCAATLMVWQSVALLRLFPSHDQSWYLIGAERLLHGTTLYGPDYSETNPPLIVWFSAIPVLLARWSSLSAMSCLRLTTLFLIGGSVWASVSLLRRQLGTARAALLAPLAVALVATFFLMNLYEFGQREQLMLAFTLPYLLALGRIDEQSRMEWVLLGLAAGVWCVPEAAAGADHCRRRALPCVCHPQLEAPVQPRASRFDCYRSGLSGSDSPADAALPQSDPSGLAQLLLGLWKFQHDVSPDSQPGPSHVAGGCRTRRFDAVCSVVCACLLPRISCLSPVSAHPWLYVFNTRDGTTRPFPRRRCSGWS